MSDRSDPIVEADELTVHRPEVASPVLRGVTLRVAPGELVYLAGPTGSGKSTLLSALSGVLPTLVPGRVEGHLRVAGRDPRAVSLAEQAAHVAHLFQNVETQLFCDRVEDEVRLPLEFGARPEGGDRDVDHEVDAVVERYGLGPRRRQRVDALSAGWKQRLALAAMHLHRKQVLLLDEPFAYLDRDAAAALQALLSTLTSQGLAVVVAEHRDDLVLPLAHRVLRLGTPDASPPALLPAPPARPTPLATAERLTFAYRREPPVLRGVELVIHQGEAALVVGDNGSGKTTLCELAAGLRRPTSGQVRVDGRSIHRLGGRRRLARAALVLQNPDRQLFQSRVGDELTGERGGALLERLGLWALRDRHPRTLSFGQKRRLTVARMLARGPALLVVDEPSIGQDAGHLKSLLDALGDHLRGGGGLLATSHDDRVAAAFGGAIRRLADGRLQAV